MFKYLLKSENFQDIVKKCSASLEKPGSFLLVPTETVYGLVCSWNDIIARENIYAAKQRSENKPFQMLASSVDMVQSFGGVISSVAEKVAKAFCPGPLTIVIPNKEGKTVGFRIPECDFILKLIESIGCPLAGTSANLSGKLPALQTSSVLSELKLMPDIAVDSGLLPAESLPSTVLEINGTRLTVLRKGPILLKEIYRAVRS